LETVGGTPVAQGERLVDGGGIEEGLVGGKMAVVDGGLGGRQRGDGEAGHGVGLGLAQRDEQQLGAVEIGAVGGGEEAAAGGEAGQDVAGGGSIEPVGAQQFEKELGTEVFRGIGEEGAEGVETEADADGAVGLGLDQLLAQGLEEGGIEPLDRLKVGDGGGDGLVGRGLELAEEGKAIYSIGQDTDMTREDNPYIISSQLKNTGVTAGIILDAYFAGTLENVLHVLEMKDGAIVPVVAV